MIPFTRAELLALPATIDIKTAARALGISSATAYRLAATNVFPVRIFRVGASYRIPAADLLDHLGINRDDPRHPGRERSGRNDQRLTPGR